MVPPPEALERGLATLAPPGVRVGARGIDGADIAMLTDGEASHVARAVLGRRAEYATGRRLLRELLESGAEIPTGSDRKPHLPPGWVGSLAHDRDFAVAAVSRDPGYAALGVDIEPDDELTEELARSILRPDDPPIDAHLGFTLKEAVYKAWSLNGGPMLEHHDVRLTTAPGTDGAPGGFRGEVLRTTTIVAGTYTHVADRWLALAVILAPPS